jgi:flagellar assembly factor FliW
MELTNQETVHMEIDPELKRDLVYFPEGLFGFETYHHFLPLAIEENDDTVLILQSYEEPELSFLIMNPFAIKEDYHPEMTAKDYERLGTNDEERISYYVVCVAREIREQSTVNLKCPIAVNVDTRQAYQVILETGDYHMRHQLSELQKRRQ